MINPSFFRGVYFFEQLKAAITIFFIRRICLSVEFLEGNKRVIYWINWFSNEI